jgi:WD40 repeat protein
MTSRIPIECLFVALAACPLAAEERPTVLEYSKYVGVRAVAFSPDGKQVAAAGGPLVRLWDAITGKEARNLEGHNKAVAAISFDPAGKILASGSHDETVVLWDLATGKAQVTLKGHSMPVNALVYSPDGKALASGGDDKVIRLWDPATAKETATLAGHRDSVLGLAYSPDGRLLASAGGDGTVRLWDPPTGQAGRTMNMLGSVWAVAVGSEAGVGRSDRRPPGHTGRAPKRVASDRIQPGRAAAGQR